MAARLVDWRAVMFRAVRPGGVPMGVGMDCVAGCLVSDERLLGLPELMLSTGRFSEPQPQLLRPVCSRWDLPRVQTKGSPQTSRALY